MVRLARKSRSTGSSRDAAPSSLVPAGIAENVPSVAAPEDPLRTGMPALDSIHARIVVASPSTPGRAYSILRTNEIDGYELEKAAKAGQPAPSMLAPVPVGDKFAGTARKTAKLSIAVAQMERFNDLQKLIQSLPSDKDMAALKPPIKTTASSVRTSKEKRNVSVKAFLYAASREQDNDFHLIVGRNPTKSPEMYMTMEISGLPPKTAKSRPTLEAARESFKSFFGGSLPGLTYDFYDPPISIEIDGSLFFDMSHATGQRPGPQSLKSRIPTIWEVHPVTNLSSSHSLIPIISTLEQQMKRKPNTQVRPPRVGMPASDSVKRIETFHSPGGRAYRIIKTTEIDAYDDPIGRDTAHKRGSPR